MAFFGLLDVNQIVADSLRSDGARRAILSQILEALKRDALWPLVGEIATDIRSEAQAAIKQLKRISEEVEVELAVALKQEAERLRGEMSARLEAFLRSTEGKELLVGLLSEALSRSEVAALTKDVEARLKEVAAHEVAALAVHAEVALQREVEEFERHADATALKLIDRIFRDAEKHFQAKRDLLIDSIYGEVHQKLDTFMDFDLPTELRYAVERHVASGPRFAQPRSNRWFAAALGISVRAVKWRRRRGELPDFSN